MFTVRLEVPFIQGQALRESACPFFFFQSANGVTPHRFQACSYTAPRTRNPSRPSSRGRPGLGSSNPAPLTKNDRILDH